MKNLQLCSDKGSVTFHNAASENPIVTKVREKLRKIDARDPGLLKRKFQALDKDDSGSIDRREITRLVKKLVAPDATKEDVKAIANALDTDKGGSITFREFQIFVSPIVETIKVRLRSLDAAKLREHFFSLIRMIVAALMLKN